MTYTPGPWRASGGEILDQQINLVAEAYSTIDDHDKIEANAALIAAAPELLVQVEFLVGFAPTVQHVRQAKAVIAKARGEA